MTDEERKDEFLDDADGGALEGVEVPVEAEGLDEPETAEASADAAAFAVTPDPEDDLLDAGEPYAAPAAGPSDHPENYTLLFCAVGIFVATMALPMEGAHLDLYARDSISGGFLAAFSAYAVLAGYLNVTRHKLIVWPIFFAAADGLYLSLKRFVQLIDRIPEGATGQEVMGVFGSGLLVILFLSLLVIWTLLKSVMGAAKKDKARKEDARAAKAAARKTSV